MVYIMLECTINLDKMHAFLISFVKYLLNKLTFLSLYTVLVPFNAILHMTMVKHHMPYIKSHPVMETAHFPSGWLFDVLFYIRLHFKVLSRGQILQPFPHNFFQECILLQARAMTCIIHRRVCQ